MAWPNSQTREVKLTVQNAQVSGSGTHNAFPVLITRANLPNEMCSPTDGNRAQSDGGDIRAGTSSGMGTQLPIEIVRWEYDTSDSAGDADIEIWVLRDLNTASDTDLWLGYNTAGTTSADAVTATYGRNAVWANYAAVWHLDQTGTQTDATGNGNSLTENGTPVASSTTPWGNDVGALDMDGTTDDYAGTSPRGNSSFVFSIWLKADTGTRTTEWLADDGSGTTGGFQTLAVSNKLRFRLDDSGSNGGVIDTSTSINDATWHLYHAEANKAGNAQQYIDGSADGASLNISGYGDISPTDSIRISTSDLAGNGIPGEYSEARIIESIPGADWYLTEYNNQSSPSTFIIESAPQAAGGGGGGSTYFTHRPMLLTGVGA